MRVVYSVLLFVVLVSNVKMNISKSIIKVFKSVKLQPLTNYLRPSSVFVGISSDKNNLEINLEKSKERFPFVWLRDNCTCEQCFHADSQSRIINWNNFKNNVTAKNVEMTQYDDVVIISWDDDHKSKFSFEWLKERSFNKKSQDKFLNEIYRPRKILWNGEDFSKVVKKYDYEDVMTNDRKLYSWLHDLATYGAVFLENVPVNEDEYKKIANKIAFIRKTHYGEEFHVIAKPGTSNVAYLSSLLQLHTDLPYYEYTPGVTMLHCIEQTKGDGGENLVTDIFYVAEKLRNENRKMFDILTSIKVNWLDIGEEDGVKYHSVFRAPVISLDSEGNIEKVYHSVPQRDSHFTVELEQVKPWYEALRKFVDLLNLCSCKFKTKPGEVFAFDNTRLAHGRLNYEDTEQNQRHLIGFYLDWDEIYSKMRVLSELSKK